jgi:hypothetical protein
MSHTTAYHDIFLISDVTNSVASLPVIELHTYT